VIQSASIYDKSLRSGCGGRSVPFRHKLSPEP
jgi:hypothetical protein